jgi:hypothetical protein
MSLVVIDDAEVTIKGDVGGKRGTIRGRARVEVGVDYTYHDIDSFYGDMAFRNSEQYFAKFTPNKDGHQFSLTVPTTDVERTATVGIDNPTVENIKVAQKSAKVPESAQVSTLKNEGLNSGKAFYVTFTWTEKV